jgi:hypothetical protein
LRFDPPLSLYKKIEQRLLTFTEEAQLKKLFIAAIQYKDMAAFQTTLDQTHAPSGVQG